METLKIIEDKLLIQKYKSNNPRHNYTEIAFTLKLPQGLKVEVSRVLSGFTALAVLDFRERHNI